MNIYNFDDVFDYPSYANERETEAPFLPRSSYPHQQTTNHTRFSHPNIPSSPIPRPSANNLSSIRSDPREWDKYCAHIDNLLYYGVDSPNLPPGHTSSQPVSLSPDTPLSAPLPMTGSSHRAGASPLCSDESGTSVEQQGQLRSPSRSASTVRWNSDSSMASSVHPTPDPLLGATAPSPWPESSPQVTQCERGDIYSGMESFEEGLEKPPTIPEHMLSEFQTDVGHATADPPTPPQRLSTPGGTNRDPRCKCSGPITDWTRHWRRSCPSNPGRSFACSNGCGKSFTRKDNMKRHVDLGECKLNRGLS